MTLYLLLYFEYNQSHEKDFLNPRPDMWADHQRFGSGFDSRRTHPGGAQPATDQLSDPDPGLGWADHLHRPGG